MKKIITLAIIALSFCVVSAECQTDTVRFTLPSSILCSYQTILIDNNTTGSTGWMTFKWYYPEGFSITYHTDSSTEFSPGELYFPAGNHTITLKAYDSTGTLIGTFADTINVLQTPLVYASAPIINCGGDTAIITAYTDMLGSTIEWTDYLGTTIYGSSLDTIRIPTYDPYYKCFKVIGTNGCISNVYAASASTGFGYMEITSYGFPEWHAFKAGAHGAMDTIIKCADYVYDTLLSFGHSYSWADTFLNIDSGYRYHWNTGDTTRYVNAMHTGIYQCTITSPHGSCPGLTQSVYVIIDTDHYNLASFKASTDSACPFAYVPLSLQTFNIFTEVGLTYNFTSDSSATYYGDMGFDDVGYGGTGFGISFGNSGWHTIKLTVFNPWDSTTNVDSVRVYIFQKINLLSSITDSVAMRCRDSITLNLRINVPVKTFWSTPLGIDSTGPDTVSRIVAHVPGLYAPTSMNDINGCWIGFTCCGGGFHVYTDTTYDTVRFRSNRSYYGTPTTTVSISAIHHDTSSVGCNYICSTDTLFTRTTMRDSIFQSDTGKIIKNHCTEDTIYTEILVAPFSFIVTTHLTSIDSFNHRSHYDTVTNLTIDTLRDTVLHFRINHYYLASTHPYVDTIRTISTCDTITTMDSGLARIWDVDSISVDKIHRQTIKHCSGLILSDTVYYINPDTLATVVYLRDSIHSFTYDTAFTTISIVSRRDSIVSVDTVVITSYSYNRPDTVAFICGQDRGTDSFQVHVRHIDSLHQVDSNVTVRLLCSGIIVSFIPHTRYDTTMSPAFNDTTFVAQIAHDTIMFPPDTTWVPNFNVSYDTLPLGNTFVYNNYDTVKFNCGEIDKKDSLNMYMYRVDSTHTIDSIRTVRNHCTGFIMLLDTTIHNTTTETVGIIRDTIIVPIFDTIMFPPDTTLDFGISWIVDTSSFLNIGVIYTNDTTTTDSSYIITTHIAKLNSFHVDSFITMSSYLLVTNHCNGDTILFLPNDSFRHKQYDYLDTAKSSTTDEILFPIKVNVYPNPFVNHITITSPGLITGTFYVDNGQKISEFNGNQKVEIDTKNLAAGIYVLSIVTNGQYLVKKMVKIE